MQLYAYISACVRAWRACVCGVHGCLAVLKELPDMLQRTDWSLQPAVMLANALTAFILNLVSTAGTHHSHDLGPAVLV